MTEKLFHIYGTPNNYHFEEYVAPKHSKNIKIIKPDTPIEAYELFQESICELEGCGILPVWTSDKMLKNFLPINEWLLVRNDGTKNIPSILKEDDVFLVGKESPDYFHIIEDLIVLGIAIISVVLGFSILFPFL